MASYPGSIWAGHSAPATLAGPPTHETMHEDISAEVVAIQTELGTNPSDSSATLTARLGLLDSQLFAKQTVRAGSTTGNTDASGNLALSFGFTYATAPIVVVCNGDGVGGYTAALISATTTGATARFRDDGTGVALGAGTAVRCNWVAVGNAP